MFQREQRNSPNFYATQPSERFKQVLELVYRGIRDAHSDRLVPQIWVIRFGCSRNKGHEATFVVKVGEDFICKIGQYPSLADLQLEELKKYRKVLGSQYTEFTKAVGLNAHGIGVGAFVYLRRIFERLVDEAAKNKQQTDESWNIDQWRSRRADEKIKDLASFLPEFLVENASLYGILRKGIHELGEDECLSYFNVVKAGIECILDEMLAKEAERERRKAVSKDIARVTGEVR